jgi:lysophospholipid acyltransferase (LPLAT)-like uncharacterized protein
MSVGGLLLAVAPPSMAVLVRLLGITLRLRVSGIEPLLPYWTGGRPLIYAMWHGRILMIPWLNARLRRTRGARAPRVLASRSTDGELVARFVRQFGLAVVRGSSSRGGTAAVRGLVAALETSEDVAVIPDGPRGPSERAQAGVVALAALTGVPVVPLAFAARPARRLATWDRFLIPAPFARAAAVFGAPLNVPRDADRERMRSQVERALNAVTAAADRLVCA